MCYTASRHSIGPARTAPQSRLSTDQALTPARQQPPTNHQRTTNRQRHSAFAQAQHTPPSTGLGNNASISAYTEPTHQTLQYTSRALHRAPATCHTYSHTPPAHHQLAHCCRSSCTSQAPPHLDEQVALLSHQGLQPLHIIQVCDVHSANELDTVGLWGDNSQC